MNIYIATLVNPTEGSQKDVILLAENITDAEALTGEGNRLDRLVIMNDWVLLDGDKEGDYFIADIVYDDAVTGKQEGLQYFAKIESFTSMENMVKEDAGESFEFIRTIEKSPYEVIDS